MELDDGEWWSPHETGLGTSFLFSESAFHATSITEQRCLESQTALNLSVASDGKYTKVRGDGASDPAGVSRPALHQEHLSTSEIVKPPQEPQHNEAFCIPRAWPWESCEGSGKRGACA